MAILYTPQQMAQALMRPSSPVQLFAPGLPFNPQGMTSLNPLQPATSQGGGSSPLDPMGLSKMLGGMMGGPAPAQAVPPNPFMSGGR